MPERTCSIEGCDSPHRSRGWCKKHYSRYLRNGDPLITLQAPPDEPFFDRLLRYVDASGDCWVWTGYTDRDGYGAGRLRGNTEMAHRAVWEELVGPIPDGLTIDHLCRNKACVNPDHLEPVTVGENRRRGVNVLVQRMLRKTHCPAGHPYSPENTYTPPGTVKRQCRTCDRLRQRKTPDSAI